ncbi:TVG1140833 [Thermoplasma volcanium GSS1]|uniref:TVG1140833 protein n=1 Tax=Thermoplasma volcanium (strain ATCC 51530 / DSM 4299 / JCM 9571 / NBRC 15438 / GSS1) TaxID=273116 RepID=Q979Q2_THEVO|nr:H/ACA ribonucleoprotein complex subunit GAR1 [Thermoplasma volcanium]BAB60250.1 TVG1140833 [Thermoplasma volcanium GSS1]
MHSCKVVSVKGREMVVKLDGLMNIHTKVYDSKGQKIGYLIKVMGPVDESYGLVSLDKPDLQEDEIYIN